MPETGYLIEPVSSINSKPTSPFINTRGRLISPLSLFAWAVCCCALSQIEMEYNNEYEQEPTYIEDDDDDEITQEDAWAVISAYFED